MGDVNINNLVERITIWITDYAVNNNVDTLVVGVSGGIDSAVVSTLCARTGIHTILLSMPIKQKAEQHNLSIAHCNWLAENYENVEYQVIDLTATFKKFASLFPDNGELSMANSRSRLRMMTLYAVAQDAIGLVVGTGNKVEDFGVGFFTKYGDGGVDISPIADLTKTEVWALGEELGVNQLIIDAEPTDGLWDDGRKDRDQLQGLTYAELEEAMRLDDLRNETQSAKPVRAFEAHEERLLEQYHKIRRPNLHKMMPVPVFKK